MGHKNGPISVFSDIPLPELQKSRALKIKRENQQVLIYLTVCVCLVISWSLGAWDFSIIWIIAVAAFIFRVWRKQLFKITEDFIHHEQLLLHRKRALSHDGETMEWLNFLFNRWWIFSSSESFPHTRKLVEPLLSHSLPSFLESLDLAAFSFGSTTPYIKRISAFEVCDDYGEEQAATPGSFMFPPSGLDHKSTYKIGMMANIELRSDDFKMVYVAKSNKGRINIFVEDLNLSGKLRILLHMDRSAPYPHIAEATFSFVEKPEAWFSVRILRAFKPMEYPVIKGWIHGRVMDALQMSLVDPYGLSIRFTETGSIADVRSSAAPGYRPAAFHEVTGDGDQGPVAVELSIIRAQDLMAKDLNGSSDPYCEVFVGKERKYKTTVKKHTLDPYWDETVLLPMITSQAAIRIMVWDKDWLESTKDSLGSVGLTKYDVRKLSDRGEPDWYRLWEAESGLIQLACRIIPGNVEEEEEPLETSATMPSEKKQKESKGFHFGFRRHTKDKHKEKPAKEKQEKQKKKQAEKDENMNVSKEELPHEQKDDNEQESQEGLPLTNEEVVNAFANKEEEMHAYIENANVPQVNVEDTDAPRDTPDLQEDEIKACIDKAEEQFMSMNQQGDIALSTPTMERGDRQYSTLPRRSKKRNIRRGMSDASQKVSHLLRRRTPSKTIENGTDDLAPQSRRKEKSRSYSSLQVSPAPVTPLTKSQSQMSLTMEMCYGIEGTLISAAGLPDSPHLFDTTLYCKLRAECVTPPDLSWRVTPMKVIAKSNPVKYSCEPVFNLEFQVSRYDKGVPSDTLIHIGLKTSHTTKVASGKISLSELFAGTGDLEVTRWVSLGDGAEVQMHVRMGKSAELTRRKGFGSLLLPVSV